MKELDDLDRMPFGKYAAARTCMQDVPASYFHFLWTEGIQTELKLNTDRGAVARYIKSRLSHLQKEHPDGIWN